MRNNLYWSKAEVVRNSPGRVLSNKIKGHAGTGLLY